MLNRLDPERERILLENARRDLAAFRELYTQYLPRVYAYICYRVGRVQDAEDLAASTFLKAVGRLSAFEWRGEGSFAAWLFRIAHDLVVDHHRRDHREASNVSLDRLHELRSDGPAPSDSTLQKEAFAHLRSLIEALPPRRQEVITLKFFGGLRNKEIAQTLGLDERTVASHLCRGLEDLHRAYAEAHIQPEKENPHGGPKQTHRAGSEVAGGDREGFGE